MNDELRVKNNELGGKMNYRYRTDEEMKDSGVEWIGKIPKDWNIISIKHIFNLIGGGTPDSGKSVYWNGEIKWVTPKDINNTSIIRDSERKITKEGLINSSAKIIPENSLVVTTRAPIGNVAINKVKITTNQGCHSLVRKSEIDNKYYYYYLLIANEEMNASGSGTTFKEISRTVLGNIKTLKINFSEENKIAKFLDEKTAQFDSIISKKEALIEKLEEAKKSLISEVVTGKVKVVKSSDGYELVERKKEEMKDSGVEWLGEIPREWKLEKGKWLFFNSNEKGNENNILLSATQDRGVIPKDELDSVVQNKEDTDFTTFKLVKKYDFIISLRSFQGGFEMSEYDNGIITPAYSVLRAKTLIEPYYYKYLLKEKGFIGILNSLTVGIRDGKNIKYDDFAKVFIPKPSIDEQSLIANYIKESVSNINLLMNKTIKQIEKLKEAKQSLISEAVTGKIEILD